MSDFQHAFSRQYPLYLILHLVGNEAKGRISKRVFQENKAHKIFRKTNISYSLIRTRTYAYQCLRNVCFSESLACFAFLKHRFEIHPFALLPTNYSFLHHFPFTHQRHPLMSLKEKVFELSDQFFEKCAALKIFGNFPVKHTCMSPFKVDERPQAIVLQAFNFLERNSISELFLETSGNFQNTFNKFRQEFVFSRVAIYTL